jgi:diaminopimelate epimerase
MSEGEDLMHFLKYHALGNDYLVMAPEEMAGNLTPEKIRLICHRNYGIGSDGILLGPLESGRCDFGLRIFNPDGSEAEKSGNGLRIFARALWDLQRVSNLPFTVETAGGKVTCTVAPEGSAVTVEMGEVRFHSTDIPVAGPTREVLNEEITVSGRRFTFCAATVGNPHCVILSPDPTPEQARQYGPLIETDARFPNRTNVQFMQVIDPGNIRIEIWERGAGYTLASGSSSTAAAAVARKLGLCGGRISVHMPGGRLDLTISDDFQAVMTGPVTKICEGVIAGEMFDANG